MAVGFLPARLEVPVDLDRDAARRLAREELAKAQYGKDRPGLVQRLLEELQERLEELTQQAADAAPGGRGGLVLVGIVLVLAVVVLLHRAGPLRRGPTAREELFRDAVTTSAEHHAAAAAYAQEGRWAESVREHLRAVVRSLEERGLLSPRSGRTADEAAAEGGEALPAVAADLRTAVEIFDAIWYGGRKATPEAAATLAEISQRVRSARAGALRPSR